MPKEPKKAGVDAVEADTRKFCVEMAIRWPVRAVGHLENAQDPKYIDDDVIGRSQKIYDWLKNLSPKPAE